MKLLFLDTETSGLIAGQDKIIEIGAVVIELDPANLKLKELARFESLIKIDFNLSDKITRLTGITDQDLQNSQVRHKVQQNWLNWIEVNAMDCNLIIGHSIGFDCRFLKAENWFLPPQIVEVDTLDLSRITFPHFKAINLEFLSKTLNLTSQDQAHRSLFDVELNIKLFAVILKTLLNLKPSQAFWQKLKQDFLKLDLEILNLPTKPEDKDLPNQTLPNQKNDQNYQFNFFTAHKNLQTFEQKIAQIDSKKLEKLLQIDFPTEVNLILCQIYLAFLWYQNNPKLKLKFHFKKPQSGFILLNCLLEILKSDELDLNSNQNFFKSEQVDLNQANLPVQIFGLERVLFQSQIFFENQIEIGKIVLTLETINLFLDSKQSILKNTIQKLIAAYDFLLSNLEPLLNKNQLKINLNQRVLETVVIKEKLLALIAGLRGLQLELKLILETNLASNILEYLFLEFKKLQSNLHLDYTKPLRIQVKYGEISLFQASDNFDFSQHFQKILLKNKIPKTSQIELETKLEMADFWELMQMTGWKNGLKNLEKEYNLSFKFNQNTSLKTIIDQDLTELILQQAEQSQQKQKLTLLLFIKNLTGQKLAEVFSSNLNPNQYLQVGETGSLTKVFSKLKTNYPGLVAIKIWQVFSLFRYQTEISFNNIIFIDAPLLPLSDFWKSKAFASKNYNNYTQKLKDFYTNYLLNSLFEKTKAEPIIWQGLK